MFKKIVLLKVLLIAGLFVLAQSGNKIKPVKLKNTSDNVTLLPYVGQKTFVLFYIDPDVQKISEPLTEAINNKQFPTNKFGAIGVVNCKDTWLPNSAIRKSVAKKQRQYPGSLLFLDEQHTLKNEWKTGNCNDAMLVYVIGKDGLIKYATGVKSETETSEIIADVIQAIEKNLN